MNKKVFVRVEVSAPNSPVLADMWNLDELTNWGSSRNHLHYVYMIHAPGQLPIVVKRVGSKQGQFQLIDDMLTEERLRLVDRMREAH